MKTLLALLILGSVAFAQAPHGTEPAKPAVKKVVKKKKAPKKAAPAPVVAPVKK